MATQSWVLRSPLGGRFSQAARQLLAWAAGGPIAVARYGRHAGSEQALAQALRQTQLALGERMYVAGIDDGETGALLHTLEEKLRGAEAGSDGAKRLSAERENLVVQLAAAALAEDGPLPGAEDEYARARAAHSAMQAYREQTAALKESLACPDEHGWRWRAAGYAVLGGSLLLGSLAASGWLR